MISLGFACQRLQLPQHVVRYLTSAFGCFPAFLLYQLVVRDQPEGIVSVGIVAAEIAVTGLGDNQGGSQGKGCEDVLHFCFFRCCRCLALLYRLALARATIALRQLLRCGSLRLRIGSS